jgi:hypothetical protein
MRPLAKTVKISANTSQPANILFFANLDFFYKITTQSQRRSTILSFFLYFDSQ